MFDGGNAVFFGIFGALVAGGFAYAIWSIRQSRRAARWPTTPGTLELVEWRQRTSGDSELFSVGVKYVYHVDGVRYSGERLAYGYQSGYSPHEHRKLYETLNDKFNTSSPVEVRYNPAKPTESCLLEDAGYRWTPLIVACVALLLFLGLLTLQYFFGGEVRPISK